MMSVLPSNFLRSMAVTMTASFVSRQNALAFAARVIQEKLQESPQLAFMDHDRFCEYAILHMLTDFYKFAGASVRAIKQPHCHAWILPSCVLIQPPTDIEGYYPGGFIPSAERRSQLLFSKDTVSGIMTSYQSHQDFEGTSLRIVKRARVVNMMQTVIFEKQGNYPPIVLQHSELLCYDSLAELMASDLMQEQIRHVGYVPFEICDAIGTPITFPYCLKGELLQCNIQSFVANTTVSDVVSPFLDGMGDEFIVFNLCKTVYATVGFPKMFPITVTDGTHTYHQTEIFETIEDFIDRTPRIRLDPINKPFFAAKYHLYIEREESLSDDFVMSNV